MTLLCFDNYLAALAHKSECDNLGFSAMGSVLCAVCERDGSDEVPDAD